LFDALEDAADGAFVVDDKLRIAYWNKAAEAILGFDKDDVTGRFCYQLLHGCDEGGHLICKARCQVAKLALNSKPVPNYDIHVTTKERENRWLNMSVFTYRIGNANGKKEIVHFFHDLNGRKFDEEVLSQLIELISYSPNISAKNGTGREPGPVTLTLREREILSHMAKGHGTKEIAKLLSVSSNTIRNHIQHILQKFQVHTRLEAVIYAIEHDLIG